MKSSRIFRCVVMAMACTSMILPSTARAAAPLAPRAAVGPMVSDVALGENGLLLGQVVNPQGVAIQNAPVSIRENGREVVNTVADAEGRFAVRGLRGGTYQVATSEGVGTYRVWSAETAPPVAQPGALLVSGDVARGQCGPCGPCGGCMGWLTNPWVVAGLVATAIAVPIIVHNNRDDDDDFDGS